MPATKHTLARPLLSFIVSHPKTVLAIFLAFTAVVGLQVKKFEVDASADTLLMKDNRHYVETQIVIRRFAPQEFLLVAYEPRNADLLSQESLTAIEQIVDRLRGMKRVESVRAIHNVPLFSLAEGRLSGDSDPSRWTLREQGFDPEEIREALADHPIYEDLIINQEQTATAIQVLFKSNAELEELNNRIVELERRTLDGELSGAERRELKDLKAQAKPIERALDKIRREEIKKIRAIMAEYDDRANVYLGGVHVLAFQLIRIIKNDLAVFGGVIALIVCVILYVLFRKWRWVFIPVLCCSCSVLITMGCFGFFGLKTTVISSNFIALQLILTLAIVVHLIVQYREYSRDHAQWDQVRLVRETLHRKAPPCFYAGITTSVGFGSLLFSGIQPVISFGWMMIIAMFVSIGVSLILFPAIIAMLNKRKESEQPALVTGLLSFLSRNTLRHAGLIAAVSSVILCLSVVGLFFLDVENSFLNYFRHSTRVYRELSFIDRHFGGSTPLDLTYTASTPGKQKDLVLTAETVQTMHRIQEALGRHEAVGKILSIVNLIELARELNDNMPLTEYELTALYWTMEDSLRENLLGSFFSPEHGQARFSVRIQDTTEGLDRAKLLAGLKKDLADLGIPEDRYMLTNLFVLYQDILQRLFRSQIVTLGIVYIVLGLTFLVIFRSLKVAMVGIVPNVLTTLAILGVMGWLRIPLDLMTITIAAVAMGIAVDDTIHYIHRYLEELEGADPDKAVERSHSSVGFAVLYTTLIIILGFSLLAFSDFVPSILFGLLTGLAMIMALLFDLTILPVLLKKFVK